MLRVEQSIKHAEHIDTYTPENSIPFELLKQPLSTLLSVLKGVN